MPAQTISFGALSGGQESRVAGVKAKLRLGKIWGNDECTSTNQTEGVPAKILQNTAEKLHTHQFSAAPFFLTFPRSLGLASTA